MNADHQLRPEVEEQIRNQIADGFTDDEILAALLDPLPARYRAIEAGPLAQAIAEVRGARIGPRHRGRPAWTGALFRRRWQEALARAGSQEIPAVARAFRARDGQIGVTPRQMRRLLRRFRTPVE